MEELKKIVVISDGTGKTAKRLVDAVLAQYSDQQVNFTIENIFQQVVNKKRADEVLKKVTSEYLVIFSIVSDDLRKYLHGILEKRNILHLNVLEPMLQTMSKFLGVHPDYKPGLLQIIDDRYYKKIDAIGFAVEHDDGRGYRIEEAELVLVGLSRTCKTPISMYIATNHGLKVANIPIIADEILRGQLLERLGKVNRRAIICLMMEAEALVHVREERAGLLADQDTAHREINVYHDLREIRNELRFCRQLLREQRWESVDVTRRAIEEISWEVMIKLHIGVDHAGEWT